MQQVVERHSEKWKDAKVLVIDEIRMLEGDTLDLLDECGKATRKWLCGRKCRGLPF